MHFAVQRRLTVGSGASPSRPTVGGAVIVAAALLCLTGCARPPVPLRGGPFAEISVHDAQQTDQHGVRVRWGGTIVRTFAEKEDTCFEVVSRPLDREARPRRTDQTDGRFLACRAGFFDPEVYSKSRELTVIGVVGDVVDDRVGDYQYRFPRLQAEAVYLWPRQDQPGAVFYAPGAYYWDPWIWGPPVYGYYYRPVPPRYGVPGPYPYPYRAPYRR